MKIDYKKNKQEYNVIICGGGTAGTIAAIQAARAGAKTALIESGNQLGGTITTGFVSFPGLFHAHGNQIIIGIGWELIEETVQMNSDVLQDFTKSYGRNHPKHQVNINPYLYALLSEEKCIEAGVDIRYYESPVSAVFTGGNWIVDVAGKGTYEKLYTKQLIDCTGNAIVAQIAGYGVLRSETCQPGSIMFKLTGYDLDKLNIELIQEKYDEALKQGILKREEYFDNIINVLSTGYYRNKLNTFTNHIHSADSTTSKTHTRANIYGRNTVLRLIRFLRTIKGLEKTIIHSMAPETSIRETYRIDGVHQITGEEYINGMEYKDAVCNSYYPIDIHNKDGVKPEILKNDVVPSIPLGALIPKNSSNFLVAGRCISSDQKANSAIRTQATCMATGQAVGVIAALAAKNNLTPTSLSINDINKLLLNHGAILPSYIL